jgi:membrane protein implicated in regulation of membrane protease activity
MQVQVRSIHLKGWLAIFVALAVFFAVAIGLAILAFGIFLFLVPVMVVASVLYYLLPRRKRRPNETERGGRSEIIDGTYRVLEDPDDDPKPPA